MAELIHSTHYEAKGPWLIDSQNLDEFDRLLDAEWIRLAAFKERSIGTAVQKILEQRIHWFGRTAKSDSELKEWRTEIEREMKDRYEYRDSRQIVLFFETDKRLTVNSFGEAMRQPDVLKEIPKRFEAEFRCGEVRVELNLTSYSREMQLSVWPDHLPEARELFVALQQWIRSVEAPRWQKIWRALVPLQWFVYPVVVYVTLGVFAFTQRIVNPYRAQAYEILTNGVTADKELKALETLLALNVGYGETRTRAPIPVWLLPLLASGLLVCVALSFCPKVCLGIGKGRDVVRRWRRWTRFVGVTVPIFIFANFVVLPVINALSRYLHLPR